VNFTGSDDWPPPNRRLSWKNISVGFLELLPPLKSIYHQNHQFSTKNQQINPEFCRFVSSTVADDASCINPRRLLSFGHQ